MSAPVKNLIIFCGCFLIALLVGSLIRKRHASRPKRNADGTLSETYLGLRRQVLQGLRGRVDLPGAKTPTEPYAVVMDWNTGNGIATVVAVADGTASIYLSSGGGSIGGGQAHHEIRESALKAVSLAREAQPKMESVLAYPLPMPGEVMFYLVSDAGVYSSSAQAKDLAEGHDPLSPLGNEMQMIIARYRLLQPGT